MSEDHLRIDRIQKGTVIDHIPSNATLKVVDILDLKGVRSIISVAANLASKTMGKKGIIKIGGKILTKEEVDELTRKLNKYYKDKDKKDKKKK